MRRFLLIISLLISQTIFAENYTVKWGMVLPLSGGVAQAGLDIQRGLEMALADFDSQHVKHEFVYEDSQYKNKDAVSAAQKLVSVDKVDILFALWDTADGVAPLADRYDKLHASVRWNSNIAETFQNTFTFESTYEDYAKNFLHLFKSLGLTKVSILNHESPGWNLAMDVVKDNAADFGIQVVNSQSYLPGETSYKVYSIKALKDKPDVVLVNDVGENLERITRSLRSINPKQRVTGYLGYPINLATFEGEYFVDQLSTDPKFAENFQKKYGEPIYARAQLAYDLFTIVASVYNGFQKKPETKTVVAKLKSYGSHQGMSGEVSNLVHNKVFRTKSHIMQVLNGKRVKVKDIKPL